MPGPIIHILVPKGVIVSGAYSSADVARLHKNTVTGLEVVPVELLDQLPLEIQEDIYQAELGDFDEDPTPLDGNDSSKPAKRR